MSFKKATVAALLAASMSSAPVMAQTAAPASVQVGESTDSASELRGGFIIPLIAVIAVILGILAAVGGNDDPPTSP